MLPWEYFKKKHSITSHFDHDCMLVLFDGDPQFLDGNGRGHVGSLTTQRMAPSVPFSKIEPVAFMCINTRLDTVCMSVCRVKQLVIILGVEEVCSGDRKQRTVSTATVMERRVPHSTYGLRTRFS